MQNFILKIAKRTYWDDVTLRTFYTRVEEAAIASENWKSWRVGEAKAMVGIEIYNEADFNL